MNISLEKLPDCKVKLSAEVPADDAKAARKTIVSKYAQHAKIPGFRPGKTPRAVVEKRYAESIENELHEELVRSILVEAQREHDLEIMGVGKLEREAFESDGTFSWTAEVVIQPEVELPDYKGLELEVPKLEVTDEMVDSFLEEKAAQMGTFEEVERESTEGDHVSVSFSGEFEEELAEKLKGDGHGFLVTAENIDLPVPAEDANEEELAAYSFIPGIVELIRGVKAGEKVEKAVTFPEDYRVEDIQGQEVPYTFEIVSVKESVPRKVDDDLAILMGQEDLESLKTRVRELYADQQAETVNNICDSQILQKISEALQFDLPQHIVRNETQRRINEIVTQKIQAGQGMDESEEGENQLIADAEMQAKNNVKLSIIIQRIADVEGLDATDEEVGQAVTGLAQQQNRPVRKVARELRDKNGFDDLRWRILYGKTLEFLRSSANVTEIDAEEWSKAQETK